MKKMLPLIAIAVLVAALTLTTGCAGGGVATTVASNQFAGDRYVGFYDEAGASSWGGTFEVVVQNDGSFKKGGIISTSTFTGFGGHASQKAYAETVRLLDNVKKGIAPGGGGGDYIVHEGAVITGRLNDDGTLHIECKVTKDVTNFPPAALADAYFMIADGKVGPHGFGFEGDGTMKYFSVNADGTRGAQTKQVSYTFNVTEPSSGYGLAGS